MHRETCKGFDTKELAVGGFDFKWVSQIIAWKLKRIRKDVGDEVFIRSRVQKCEALDTMDMNWDGK